jgi:oligopeptide/dipeptide ABC transporter ATP-binding protein
MLLGLLTPTTGRVRFDGIDLATAGAEQQRQLRKRMQIVFQDPHSSLDPRRPVGSQIADGLAIHNIIPPAERRARVEALLVQVGLPAGNADRYPHQFSGGQRQRIGIARALALKPDFIVCDEPVSSLDVSMQAQIVNLLLDLQERLGLSYLFIAHDLAVVRSISARVAVMYAGSIVEIAPKRELYTAPRHPYTQALLAAIPRVRPNRARTAVVTGELPSQIDMMPGCTFHPRCPFAFERCRAEKPKLRDIAPGHLAACHLHQVPA